MMACANSTAVKTIVATKYFWILRSTWVESKKSITAFKVLGVFVADSESTLKNIRNELQLEAWQMPAYANS